MINILATILVENCIDSFVERIIPSTVQQICFFFVCLIFRSYLRSSTPVIIHTDDDAIMTIQLADLHTAEDKYHFWVESTKFRSINK